jgi:hypothetical protein
LDRFVFSLLKTSVIALLPEIWETAATAWKSVCLILHRDLGLWLLDAFHVSAPRTSRLFFVAHAELK